MATDPPNSRGNGSTLVAKAHEDDNAGLGALLKRAREARGLTLDQLSNDTKIPKRHLEALERGDLSALPAGFYQRAKIRTYARAVNLDPTLAIARLDRQLEPAAARAPRSGASTPGFTVSGQWLLILAGVLIAAVVLMRTIGGREAARAAEVAPPAVVDSAPERVATPESVGVGREVVPAAREIPPVVVPETPPDPPLVAPADQPSIASAAAAQVAPPNAPANGSVTAPAPTPAAVAPAPAPPPAPPPDPPANVVEPAEPARSSEPAAALVLITEPAGARITVNGIGWGVTPLAIRYLPEGDKRIRVSKDGYVTDERVVRVTEGRPTRINIRLQPVP
jgi:cytoskeleton protein RodZ